MPLSQLLSTYHPNQPEFHQAVSEVMDSLQDFITANPKYSSQSLLERIIEPERIIIFRIPRVDDAGQVQVNR
jgi:glutamate dehydrogenase (NADP+)